MTDEEDASKGREEASSLHEPSDAGVSHPNGQQLALRDATPLHPRHGGDSLLSRARDCHLRSHTQDLHAV